MTAFRLTLTADARHIVEVDGHDLTRQVAGLQVQFEPHHPPVLTLVAVEGVVIAADGIVQAVQDPAGAVAALDPAQVAAEAQDPMTSWPPQVGDVLAAVVRMLRAST